MEEGERAADIAIGQMLEADGDLDEPLQGDARASLGPHPVRLEQLVHLEVEMRVEEQGGGDERGGERRVGGVEGAPAQHPPGALRALGELDLIGLPRALEAPHALTMLEEIRGKGVGDRLGCRHTARLDAHGHDHLEGLARLRVVQRVQDQVGQTIAQRQGQRHIRRARLAGC